MRMQPRFIQNRTAALVAVVATLIANVNFTHAQQIQPEILFSFTNSPAYPAGALVQGNDGSFYGTTAGGGSFGAGAVFRVTTNGVLTTLASFNDTDGSVPNGLTLGSDGNFYGTTSGYALEGEYVNGGTVFRVTTNGVLTTLVSFADTDGANPSGLTLGNDGNFYGTTVIGGSFRYYGTVFKVTTNGVLTTLTSFNGTNGAYPEGGLTLGSDGSFYGTTFYGGDGWNANLGGGNGTVFQVTTNGVLTTLTSFNGNNGVYPEAGLTLGNDGNFYGTTLASASFGEYGTVFKVTTNGVLTTLVWFDWSSETHNSGGLTLGKDSNFYGTVSGIDPYDYPTTDGTVFRVTTNGDLTTLVSFNGTNGANPYNVGLTLGSDGNFYGTTSRGGSAGRGTVFRVTTNGVLTTLVGFDSSSETSFSGGLTLGNDGNFYGTISGIAPYGDPTTDGTVFRVTTNGDLTTLVSFNGTNGANPYNVGLTLGTATATSTARPRGVETCH